MVAGQVHLDRVRIAGLELLEQDFLVTDVEVGMNNVYADGVLGLALPGLSHTGVTIVEQLRQEVNTSAFVMFLTGSSTGSFIMFGSVDEAWGSNRDIVWVPAVTGLWWAIDAALTVGSEVVSGTFLVDSGTSYL